LKEPRLDQAHQLVEAKKKTYAQVDVVDESGALEAEVIVVHRDRFHDLLLKDLELIETRLGRAPAEAERLALEKLQIALEHERTVLAAGLTAEELAAVAAHSFQTNKAVTVAADGEGEQPDRLMLRAFQESGHICFLTVGGKENRAWPIRRGTTAWEAAGAIHSDLQKGFIRAEIISFEDFLQTGGETEAKRAGKLRLETKQYTMQDCDLVHFRFNK
jgi:ribosome-binding ATPase YchF (GTP1/OBG family)